MRFKVAVVRDNVKNMKNFKGIKSLSKLISTKLIPMAIESGLNIEVVGSDILAK